MFPSSGVRLTTIPSSPVIEGVVSSQFVMVKGEELEWGLVAETSYSGVQGIRRTRGSTLL